MQGKHHRRLNVFWVIGLIAALAGTAAAQGGRAIPGVTGRPVGLVMDSRAVAYTVDRDTGKVFRLAEGDEPVHYATIEEEPTSIAVDRQRTLFIGTTSGQVLAVRMDGAVRHACRCPAPVSGLAVDRDGGLLVTMDNGALLKVRRRDLALE